MIKKALSILAFLTAFCISLCKGQSDDFRITGIVLEKITFKPLANVTVEFSSNGSNKISTITDTAGKFSINLNRKGKYVVSVSSVTYKDTSIGSLDLGKETTLEPIYLEADVTDLSSVTVTAKNPTIKKLFDKLIVSVANTSLTASGNVFDLLQKLPGVQMQQDGLILLKGKIVEVWIDNRPTNLTGSELKNYLNSLNSGSIEKVELISNPSVKFDASASAIINIKTVKVKKAGFNGTVNAGVAHGEYFRTYDGINLNYQTKKLTLYGSYNISYEKENLGSRSQRTTLFNSNPGSIIIHDQTVETRNSHQARMGMDYSINKRNSIGVLLNAGFNNSRNDSKNSTFLSAIPNPVDSVIVLNTNPVNAFANPSVNLYYNASLDSLGTSLRINADYWNYKQSSSAYLANYFYDKNVMPFRTPYFLRTKLPASNEIKALKIDFEKPYKKGTITAGLKISGTKRDNDLLWEIYDSLNLVWKKDTSKTNHFIFKENVYAMYAGYEKEFNKINLQILFRAEGTTIEGVSKTNASKFNQDYFKIFPSLALDYNISEKNQLSFSYRKSINRPAYSYLDPFNIFISQYSTLKGNPKLEPQIVNSFEISHGYKQTFFTTFTFSRTNKAVSRVFVKDNSTNVLTTTFDNLGYFSNYSLDFSFSKPIKPFWFVSFNSTAFYTNVNTTINNAPVKNNSFGFNATVFSNFMLPKSMSLDVFFIYAAPFASTVFKYKASSFLNVGFHMPVLKGKGTLNLFVSDIFRTARTSYLTRQNDINLTYYRSYDDRYGNISLNYRFGSKTLKQIRERRTGIESEKTRMKNIAQ